MYFLYITRTLTRCEFFISHSILHWLYIEIVSLEGTFHDTVYGPSGASDMQLI